MAYTKTWIKDNKILQLEEGRSSGSLYVPTSDTIEQVKKLNSIEEIKHVLDGQFVGPAISSYLDSTEEQKNYPLFLAAGEIEDPQTERNIMIAIYAIINHDYQMNQYKITVSKLLKWPLTASSILFGVETTKLFLNNTTGDFFCIPVMFTSALYGAALFAAKHRVLPSTKKLKERLELLRPTTVIESTIYHKILTSQV